MHRFHPSLSFIYACKFAFSPPQSCVPFVLQLGCCWSFGCRWHCFVLCIWDWRAFHPRQPYCISLSHQIQTIQSFTRQTDLSDKGCTWWCRCFFVTTLISMNFVRLHRLGSLSVHHFLGQESPVLLLSFRSPSVKQSPQDQTDIWCNVTI